MTGIMTSIIGLSFGLYFGPTQEQINYCMDDWWYYECANNNYILTQEAKTKAKLCEKLLDTDEAIYMLRYE